MSAVVSALFWKGVIMKTVIVFESMFGNTRDVAMAIEAGLLSESMVEVYEVGVAPDTIGADVDLLIAGGPTHQFGISRPSSRAQAGGQVSEPLVSQGRGIREWLETVQIESRELRFAAFDTTMQSPRFLKYMGRASRKIHKALSRKGLTAAAPAESFWVDGGQGPLADGENERARLWAASLASATLSSVPEAVTH